MPSRVDPGSRKLSFGLLPASLLVALAASTPAQARNRGVPASLVLGQADFTHVQDNLVDAKGLSDPHSAAVDSSGHLYVSDRKNNRVLGWRRAAALSSGQPADLVIGQGDFLSHQCNRGHGRASVAADGLCNPQGLAVDGSGNLYIADSGNNRVLEYLDLFAPGGGTPGKPGSAGDTTADRVYGQPNFESSQWGGGAERLFLPSGVAVDRNGNLYIADTNNNRVLAYRQPAARPDLRRAPGSARADKVFGQGGRFDGDRCNSGFDREPSPSAKSLCFPAALAVDTSGNLYVADTGNSRVLKYNAPLADDGDTIADAVFGQVAATNFATGQCRSSATGLCRPEGVVVDNSGDLYVADTGNNRVLEFATASGPAGHSAAAGRVFGQGGSFSSNSSNRSGPGAGSLASPTGVAVDASANLYIVDSVNNRVLVYDRRNRRDTTANGVLGQVDFTHLRPNLIDARGLAFPIGLALDAAGHIYVSDADNNRVLGWRDRAKLRNGEPADLVIGQPDFFSSRCNRGSGAPRANSLCEPTGLVVDSAGNLYIADRTNNRVLEYRDPFELCRALPCVAGAATKVFGQADFESGPCNRGAQGPAADSLCRPFGLAVDGSTSLYVGDAGNNRVVWYDRPLAGRAGGPGGPGSPGDTTADKVFGQGGAFNKAECDGSDGRTVTADSLCSPAGVAVDEAGNLYVADAGNNRVLAYDTPLAPSADGLGKPGSPGDTTADKVFGQHGRFDRQACNGKNKTTASAETLCSPTGVALDASGNLYVADFSNARVLMFRRPLAKPDSSGGKGAVAAAMVLGQPDLRSRGVNAGGKPSPYGLAGPFDLAVDGAGNLFVADTENNRVLKYEHPLRPAQAPRKADGGGG